MLLQPSRQGVRLAVRQQRDPLSPFQVDQHGAIPVAFTKCPVIDTQDRRGRANRQGRRTDQPQQRVARGRDAEVPAEPGAGGTAEGHGDGGEALAEPQRPACPRGDDARQALGEDPPPAVGIVAEQLAHAQLQPDGPAGPGQIRQGPLVMAVKTPRRHMAQRAFRSRLPRDQAQSGGGLVWVNVPGDGVKAGRIR